MKEMNLMNQLQVKVIAQLAIKRKLKMFRNYREIFVMLLRQTLSQQVGVVNIQMQTSQIV